jgi:hypothetical protein
VTGRMSSEQARLTTKHVGVGRRPGTRVRAHDKVYASSVAITRSMRAAQLCLPATGCLPVEIEAMNFLSSMDTLYVPSFCSWGSGMPWSARIRVTCAMMVSCNAEQHTYGDRGHAHDDVSAE